MLLASACRPGRTLEEVESALERDPGPSVLQTGREVGPATPDTLEGRFDRVRDLFVHRGTPLFAPESIGLDGGHGVDRSVELRSGDCITVLAVGERGGPALELALHEPTGRVVARDGGADAFPVLQGYCAEEAGVHTMRLRSRSAQVTVRWGAFRVDDETSGRSARRIEELARRHAPGMRPHGPVNEEWLIEGERRSVALMLRPGRCHALLAVGPGFSRDVPVPRIREEEPVQVDAILYRPDGIRFSQDIGVDATPVIVDICPEDGRAWRYELVLYRGSGAVHWQLWSDSPTLPDGTE